MKSTAFLATFSLILFIEIINGQHNSLVYNDNLEINSPTSQQQPIHTYAMTNSVQDLLNPNGNTKPIPNNLNQHQILIQTNVPPLSPSMQQIPPDLQQQPLQVQQYLQLQQPLQQVLQLKRQMETQPLLQSPDPTQIRNEAQQSLIQQDIVQIQPQIQVPSQQSQHNSQIQQSLPLQQTQILQSCPPVQNLQPLQSRQTLQSLQSQQPLPTSPPVKLHQKLQTPDFFQAIQPQHLQQLLEFQHSPLQKLLTENKNVLEMADIQRKNNNQANSQIHVKWETSNPQTAMNVENHYEPNLNNQRQHNFINRPIDFIVNAQKSHDYPQEIQSLRYHIASSQPPPVLASIPPSPVVSNSNSVVPIQNNYIKPSEDTYVPVIAPYNYIIPISEIPLSVLERTRLPVPNLPIQSDNSQYYNQQADFYLGRQNAYINQNSGFRYIEKPRIPVSIQSQSLLPSQSSVSSFIPIQAPSVPLYGVSSDYPVNNIVAPVYTSHKPKQLNMKSILPLVFNLLKEKITSCGCKNSCPCSCNNNSSDNELDVASEYSSRRHYGSFNTENLSVLNNVSEEVEGLCLRETKSCKKDKQVSSEMSSETLEEEDSNEEEVEDDEDS